MKKSIFTLLICFGIISCGTVRTSYDYDREALFANYKTYSFYPELSTGLSELDERRALKAIDEAFQQKGIAQAEDADMMINLYSEIYRNQPSNSVGVGVGGTGRNVGGGISLGIPVGGGNFRQELVIEAIDSHSGTLFWQGIGRSAFNVNAEPEEREAYFSRIISEILSKFPPR